MDSEQKLIIYNILTEMMIDVVDNGETVIKLGTPQSKAIRVILVDLGEEIRANKQLAVD